MKTLSAQMEICRQERSHDIAWLAELDWDDAVGRYGSRPATIGGVEYEPIISSVEGLRFSMSAAALPRPERVTARLELVNVRDAAGQRFESKTADQTLEGRTVRIGFVFIDPVVALEAEDVVWLQTFQIHRIDLGTTKAVLHLLEPPAAAAGRLLGRRLLPGVDPYLSDDAVGRMIPFIFGRIERAALIPFRIGRRTCLRTTLGAEETIVAVEDARGFPDSGAIQIEDEMISYAAVDRNGRTLGRADSPVIRTAPAHHRSGRAVVLVPQGGFEYLIADHPCRSVGPIFSGEHLIDASDYAPAAEVYDGREVQKVVFPRLPTETSYSAGTTLRRVNGREDVNLWGIGAGNGALNPLAPVTESDPTAAAVVSASRTPLEVEYLGNLSAGLTRHGVPVRYLLRVEYSASERWSVTNQISVAAGRGQSSVEFTLGRPTVSESQATFPAHSHADTIRDEVEDTRGLFEISEQSVLVGFDRIEAAGGWSNRERAIEGNLDTWCENTPAGGPKVTTPLTATLLREPLNGQAIKLEAIEFHVRMATDESSSVQAALDVAIAGKLVDSAFVSVDGAAATHLFVVEASGLEMADLIDAATAFAVRSVDGRQIKVFGLWLRLRYRPKIAGREETASQMRTGSVAAAAPAPVSLPTGRYRQEFDLTDFLEANGGWGFFAPQGSDRPFVRISYGSGSDTAQLYVSFLEFEVEYRSRSNVTVFDRFDATVEGIEVGGGLLEDPADIIEWLVTDEAGFGWGAGAIDPNSFEAARVWFAARDLRLSRRVATPRPLMALLDEIARESVCRLAWEAGSFRIWPQPSLLLSSECVATLDDSVILSAPLEKRGSSLDDVANVLRLRFGAEETVSGRARWLEVADPGSEALSWGRREREVLVRWHTGSPGDRAGRLGAMLLAGTAQAARRVEIDLPMSQCRLERGDVVIADHPESNLAQAVGQIVATEFVDGRWMRATVALQLLARYCWYGDAQTFIVHLPGHSEKVFVLEGVRVAVLDRTGCLRLGGEAVEEGLAPHSMAAEIEHDAAAHRLYFGVGSAGSGYSAVFALDDQGRLLLRGTATEQADLSAIVTGDCHEADASGFLFSCDLSTVLLAYDAGVDRLRLEGRIVENAPL